MSEERDMPEQRAFSPEEVATMLGVARTTVAALIEDGALGSKEIGDVRRIFLSDLEDYLGEERARSLVREINRDDGDARSRTSESSRSESAETSDIEYYARISEKGRDPRRKSWPLDTSQKMTAQKRLNRLREAFDRGDWDPWEGGWLSPEPVPLQESIDAFLSDKEHLRPRTQDTYAGILRRFKEQLPPGAMLQDVEPDDVKAYIRDSDLSSASQHKRFRHLRAFFNWTVDEGKLERSPIEEVDAPKKEEKEKAFLRPEDVKTLLSTIENHVLETRDALGQISDLKWLYRMIQVAVATGLRRGELVALQWADVNLEKRSIHVRHRGDFRTKGNAERRVPIRGDAEDALVQMHEPGISGPVFTDRDGEPIRPGRVTTRFKDMARKADLDERIHFHSLRHTTGSWLSMRGVPMRHIQAILGHSDRNVTEKYSHLAPETLDRAMEETFGSDDGDS